MGNVSAGAVSADLVLNNKMGPVIAAASTQLNGIETKMKAAGMSIASSFDGPLNKLKQMPAETKYLGAALALGVTAPILAFGKASTKTFSDFDDAMRQVQAVTSATGPQFQALTDLAREMGETTSFKASEAAEAMNYLGMAGFDANEIVSALPSTLALARAGVLDLGSAADIMSNVMTIFSLRTEDAAHVADVLAKVAHTTNTNVSQLGEAMSYAGPVAATFGMSMEQTAAAMGMLGNAGIQASMAGTTLRGILQELVAPTKASMDVFSKYGLALSDLDPKLHSLDQIFRTLKESGMSDADMFQIFGQRAGPGLLALLNQGIDKLGDYSISLDNLGGYAQQAAETMDAGFGGSMRRMNSAFESLSISIGGRLAVMLEPLVNFATKAAAAFADMNPHLQDMIIIFGLVAAAIGPVILALAALPTIVAGVSGGLALLSGAGAAIASVLSGGIIPAIAAVGAALYILEEKTGAVSFTWRLLKDLFTITVDGIMKAARILRDYIVEKMGEIKQAILDMLPVGFLESVGKTIDKITSQFKTMGDGINDQAEEIRNSNKNIETSTDTAKDKVVEATGIMQNGYLNTGIVAGDMAIKTDAATGQMSGGLFQVGADALIMAGKVGGAVSPIELLKAMTGQATTVNQSYAASFINVANQASDAASAAISSASRIGSAIKTSISQVGELEALAGKWNTRAKIGVTSGGGAGTGEGNVKIRDHTGQYAAPVTRSGGGGTGERNVKITNVKINNQYNTGQKVSTVKTKSAV